MIPGEEKRRFAIGDLASLAGVSRRTIRYYAQQGLLPAPFGRGRGKNYGEAHLARLLRIKSLQEHGFSLAAVRQLLAEGDTSDPLVAARSALRLDAPPATLHELEAPQVEALAEADATFRLECSPASAYTAAAPLESAPPSPSRTRWTRVVLAPGIELHVSSDHRLPPPGRLQELARFCVREFKLLARRSPK